jgi:hypothetical protein
MQAPKELIPCCGHAINVVLHNQQKLEVTGWCELRVDVLAARVVNYEFETHSIAEDRKNWHPILGI